MDLKILARSMSGLTIWNVIDALLPVEGLTISAVAASQSGTTIPVADATFQVWPIGNVYWVFMLHGVVWRPRPRPALTSAWSPAPMRVKPTR